MNQTVAVSVPSAKTAALVTLISVFFFWGFVAASNDILIPVFKEKLGLSQGQSQLVAVAFYVAYTVGSLIYTGLSAMMGGDILNRIGYKNGIALGLVISALGTLLFYPAANTASFPLMLTGLFVVALGFALQQIAANPLAIVLGDPKKGAQRLSLAGGVNNFGTTIGPLLVSLAIFGSVSSGNTEASIEAVKTPYLILGAAFILVAIIFKFSSLPNKIDLEGTPADDSKKQVHEIVEQAETETILPLQKAKGSALGYSQLWLGMIGIFVYVGVEVATAANLPEYLKQHVKGENGEPFPTNLVAPFISLYWASLMIGRWAAATGAFNISKSTKQVLALVMPFVAFGVFLLVNKIADHDVQPFFIYVVPIIGLVILDYLSKGNPARQLLLFSLAGIVSLFIGMTTTGMLSVFAFASVGLFCSTLWPCIFTLAIAGLGRHTNQGASFLVMMIMGGGIISYLQGLVASDDLLGIQWSYLVGVVCFAYLAFYAIRAKAILKAQGIDYDKQSAAGGH